MTLTQTIVAPWGIWQAVDYRLTYKGKLFDNWSHKSAIIHCTDGAALLSYTGLGRFDLRPDSPDIADWLAKQLQGHEDTVNEALHRIKDAASREKRFRQTHQIFSVGAIAQGQMWAAVIVNHEPTADWRNYPPRNVFELSAMQVANEPLVIPCGETRAISQADSQLLETVAKRRPRRSKDFLKLLAGINKRASENKRYGHMISAECAVCFMPPTINGAYSRTFPEDHDIPWSMLGVPRVMFGLDFTEVAREGVRRLEEEVRKNKAAGLI